MNKIKSKSTQLWDPLDFKTQVLNNEKHYNRNTGNPKRSYDTELDAFDKVKELGLEDYTFYSCPICKKFHVGHLK